MYDFQTQFFRCILLLRCSLSPTSLCDSVVFQCRTRNLSSKFEDHFLKYEFCECEVFEENILQYSSVAYSIACSNRFLISECLFTLAKNGAFVSTISMLAPTQCAKQFVCIDSFYSPRTKYVTLYKEGMSAEEAQKCYNSFFFLHEHYN